MANDSESFIESISDAYRFKRGTQIILFILTILTTIVITELLVIPYDLRFITGIVVAAFTFPLFIKDRNRYTRALSLGFFLSAFSSLIWYLGFILVPIDPYSQTSALLFAIITALSIQLFDYLLPGLIKRNSFGYAVIGLFSGVFTLFTLMGLGFFPPFAVLSIWSLVSFCIIFMIFFSAVLPEKPV